MQATDNVIVPFAGHPAANIQGSSPHSIYGLQKDATPMVGELAATVHATINHCQPHARAAAAKSALRGYLCDKDLLTAAQREGDTHNYRRHLLYADPNRQFSILAIVWLPGQQTPIHGHTAWGTVGIYAGHPYCDVFAPHGQQQSAIRQQLLVKNQLKPGDLSCVQPGIDDAHRLGNDSHSKCITIHIYGRDLLAHPRSINICIDL